MVVVLVLVTFDIGQGGVPDCCLAVAEPRVCQTGGRPLIRCSAHGQWERCLSLSAREQRGAPPCPLASAMAGRGGYLVCGLSSGSK